MLKNSDRNDRQVVRRVEFETLAGCSNTVCAIDVIALTCPERDPGKTLMSVISMLNPACRTFAGVLDPFI